MFFDNHLLLDAPINLQYQFINSSISPYFVYFVVVKDSS